MAFPSQQYLAVRRTFPALAACALGLGLVVVSSGCNALHKPPNTNPLAGIKSNQPDKVLFDRAMGNMDKGAFVVARLDLETLLNTYPDSEYLARAKMGIADSWYREGGTEGMAQAEAQYKDFITFFPAMKEASEAQLKVATIHFRDLQKPDRDPTEAERSQAELRTFLVQYPTSPLRDQALQMLRDTQEILAEREFRIGTFYFERAVTGDSFAYRAGQGRYEELLDKYPLYSQGDLALDELANSYLTTSNLYAGAAPSRPDASIKNLYLANSTSDRATAIADFTRLAERYPVSPYAKDAQAKLTALHAPVPKPTEAAIEFNKKEIAGRGIASSFAKVSGALTSRPGQDMARADKVGTPSLAEPDFTPTNPPPGLDELVRATLAASGAPTPNVALSADASGTKVVTASTPVPPPSASSATAKVHAAGDQTNPTLSLEDVPDPSKSAGVDQPETSTPQSYTGSNGDDPNLRKNANQPSTMMLTPNEIDTQTKVAIMATEVQRDVPPPAKDLAKQAAQQAAAAKKQAKMQADALAKAKKEFKAQPPPAKPDASSGGTPNAPDAPKKSFFGRIF